MNTDSGDENDYPGLLGTWQHSKIWEDYVNKAFGEMREVEGIYPKEKQETETEKIDRLWRAVCEASQS